MDIKKYGSMIEYTIKRKSNLKPFKCPECKIGDLKFIGLQLFRFKCLNKECDSYFM